MKKIAKSLIAIFLIVIMCMTNVAVFASNEQTNTNEGIAPCLSHVENGSFTFSATADGGYVDVTYYGYDSFVRADLTVKIEKRIFLAIWDYVDEWSASSTEIEGGFFHVFTLNGSGTYRATFTLTITGNDGTVDTIPDVIKSKY